MASDFDASEFVDEDFQSPSPTTAAAAAAAATNAPPDRAPSRHEVESKVTQMQQRLTELKSAQQELEREKSSLEELRRRQAEFSLGKEEMTHHLTRGIGLLEEAELTARREVDQMSRILEEFRDALDKIQHIEPENWTKTTLEVELTRANTTIENGRMEWNSALVKLPFLSEDPTTSETSGGLASGQGTDSQLAKYLDQKSYAEICKLGLALTWPIALAGLAIFLVLLMR